MESDSSLSIFVHRQAACATEDAEQASLRTASEFMPCARHGVVYGEETGERASAIQASGSQASLSAAGSLNQSGGDRF